MYANICFIGNGDFLRNLLVISYFKENSAELTKFRFYYKLWNYYKYTFPSYHTNNAIST